MRPIPPKVRAMAKGQESIGQRVFSTLYHGDGCSADGRASPPDLAMAMYAGAASCRWLDTSMSTALGTITGHGRRPRHG